MAEQYTQQQATDAMRAQNDMIVKIAAEVDGALESNKKLQEALDAAGGPGGTITPELAQEIKNSGVHLSAIHEQLPDVPQPE